MNELLHASVLAPNLFQTILLLFVLIYWLTVIMGLADLDFFDFDLEMDLDIDADISTGSDAVGGGTGIAWLNSVLAFFNLGKIPFMIYLTFLVVPFWAISVYVNDFIGNKNLVLGLVLMAPILFVSLILAKFFTIPFVKLFGKLEKDEEHESMIGKIAFALTTINDKSPGQASIKTKGAPIIINAKTSGNQTLKKGQSAIILEHNKENNSYTVQPYE